MAEQTDRCSTKTHTQRFVTQRKSFGSSTPHSRNERSGRRTVISKVFLVGDD